MSLRAINPQGGYWERGLLPLSLQSSNHPSNLYKNVIELQLKQVHNREISLLILTKLIPVFLTDVCKHIQKYIDKFSLMKLGATHTASEQVCILVM